MKPRVGVSACLLGERVRYDGGHKQQPWRAAFAERFEWVAVCPEMEVGMGVPRETIQIEAAGPEDVLLVGTQSRRDWTRAMRDWAAERLQDLAAGGLDAYVFKARSPSCGLGTTPVVGRDETRDGLFAEAVRARLPLLPVADEEALRTEAGRARFIRLARANRDLRVLFHPGWARADAVNFHSRRKLDLMARSPDAYAELGRLVARVADLAPEEFERDYKTRFLEAFSQDPTPGRHSNALAHAAGYFSGDLPPDERAELAREIERIGQGRTAGLEAVKARIVGYARRFGHFYLVQQTYLEPCESI